MFDVLAVLVTCAPPLALDATLGLASVLPHMSTSMAALSVFGHPVSVNSELLRRGTSVKVSRPHMEPCFPRASSCLSENLAGLQM